MQDLEGKAMTVLGPVAADELGIVLPHEHLLAYAPHVMTVPQEAGKRAVYHAPMSMEILSALKYGGMVNRENCQFLDAGAAIEEILAFRNAGGATVADVTSRGIGRDPAGLARIARVTGLNVIMGSSYYVEAVWPADWDMDARSEDDIARGIVDEICEGVGDTGVRPGIIGEVGCSWPMTANERKVLRASARAQRLTGAPLMVHPGRDQGAPLEIIAVLKEAGADLRRTIMCHVDRTIDREPVLKELAETGCMIEYDLFGYEGSYYAWTLPLDMPNDARRLRWLAWLIAEGHGNQILVSHDIYFKDKLVRYGGHGYAHILANVVPLMRRHGFTEETIHTILVENPKRVLPFAAARELASP